MLVAQQSLVDPTRAPAGHHTLWAYCHVPNGSTVDMTAAIERQIERFAPGFSELVLARAARGPAELEADNPNYIGGDINGGLANLRQVLARPVLSACPYATPNPRLYLCSSSTPPGGGRARHVRLPRRARRASARAEVALVRRPASFQAAGSSGRREVHLQDVCRARTGRGPPRAPWQS